MDLTALSKGCGGASKVSEVDQDQPRSAAAPSVSELYVEGFGRHSGIPHDQMSRGEVTDNPQVSVSRSNAVGRGTPLMIPGRWAQKARQKGALGGEPAPETPASTSQVRVLRGLRRAGTVGGLGPVYPPVKC